MIHISLLVSFTSAAHKTYKISSWKPKKGEEDPWNDPDEVWFLFPNDEDGDEVYLSGLGKYAYNKTMEKYLSVQRTEYATGYVKMQIAIYVGEEQKWKTMDFGRVCLQSFIGRRLKVWETCDHGDHNRENNSYDNLFPRHRLFQGYNKKIHRDGNHLDISEVGVAKKGNHWIATVTSYTLDGPTATKQISKSFSKMEDALKFRRQFTLNKGMCFDCPERVAPTIVNCKRVENNGKTDESDQKLPASRNKHRVQTSVDKENALPLPSRKRSRKD